VQIRQEYLRAHIRIYNIQCKLNYEIRDEERDRGCSMHGKEIYYFGGTARRKDTG
jgi:hypothetical protein